MFDVQSFGCSTLGECSFNQAVQSFPRNGQSMKKGRLAPYILVSFLIHAGFFIGAHRFLKLPAEEVETAEFIPVEMVVIREESPASPSELVHAARIWPKEVLQTKSQIRMETASDQSADFMATPIPKAGDFEPKLKIGATPTTGYSAEAQPGECADSKPIVPSRQLSPPQISPEVLPAPIDTAPLRVEIPTDLLEAKAKPIQAVFQAPQRVTTPLPASRPAAEPVFAPPPLATTSNEEPALNVVAVHRRDFTPGARNGESVAVKTTIPASPTFPTQVSPVYPSAPTESSQLEVKIPAVFVEAPAMLTPADSQSPQKVATPLPSGRTLAGPVFEPPRLSTKSDEEPHVNVFTVPMRGFTRVARTGESIAGKPMILASQLSTLQVFPADPSPPSTSSPLDVRIPAVPIEAKSATFPAYSQSSKKIETPLASRRRFEDRSPEHQPLPREGTAEPMLMVSTLQVQGQPNGAQVYVNDYPIGKTPLSWELPVGKHEVRLALPDYYEWESQVELTPEHKNFPIKFRLLPIEE
jgi:hypothetical protein